jgi:RND family efflux transporter MFP subunit
MRGSPDLRSLSALSADNPKRGPHHAASLRSVLGLALAALLITVVAGCNHEAAPAAGSKAVEVIVTAPIWDEVADYQDFTGRLDALDSVEVRPRASGYITFAIPREKEGKEVQEGELLFQIDPKTYEADLNQAEANLKVAISDRKLQEKNIDRIAQLVPKGLATREEYDTVVAMHEKSISNVEATTAARDRARLYLGYTRVTAPIKGKLSKRMVDPGNLVTADQTMLTTIVAEDPIYAWFDVDERTYLDLLKAAPAHKDSGTSPSPELPPTPVRPGAQQAAAGSHGAKMNPWLKDLQFPVLIRLANEEEFAHSGTVNFLDNRVSSTTGTIRMRGVIPNPDHMLTPGLFARIRLPIGQSYKALLISDEAVFSDQGRKAVYVVNAEDKVEYRAVTLGQSIHGLRVIKDGLAEGDRVVISGMQRVRPGSAVTVKKKDPPKPPGSPLTRMLSHYWENHAAPGGKVTGE